MRTLMRFIAIVMVMPGAVACGRTPPPGSAQAAEETILVVDNQSTLQATLYVLRDSQRQRLGTANALTSTRLRIPDSMVFGPTSLQFEVHLLGSRHEPISERITVTRGQQVRLIVPSTYR